MMKSKSIGCFWVLLAVVGFVLPGCDSQSISDAARRSFSGFAVNLVTMAITETIGQ